MDLTIDHQNGYKIFWGPASFPVLTKETSSVVGFDTPELAELLVSSNLSLYVGLFNLVTSSDEFTTCTLEC